MNDIELEIYTIPDCPKCKKLKFWLDAEDIPYRHVDLSTTEGMAEGAYLELLDKTFPVVYILGVRLKTSEPSRFRRSLHRMLTHMRVMSSRSNSAYYVVHETFSLLFFFIRPSIARIHPLNQIDSFSE